MGIVIDVIRFMKIEAKVQLKGLENLKIVIARKASHRAFGCSSNKSFNEVFEKSFNKKFSDKD